MNLIVLTLFCPFIGLLYSIINWRLPNAKNAFWLGCCYLGAVMIYWPDGEALGEGSDAGRYYMDFLSSANEGNLGKIVTLHTVYNETPDIFKPLMEFLVSRLTTNGHALFFAYAVVLGFFISRNLWYLLEHMPRLNNNFYVIWLFLFFLEVPIWKINGARMATGFHMFMFGLLPYLLEGDRRKIYWCGLAVLSHFSFLYFAVFTILYVYLPNRFKDNGTIAAIALVFFIATLFVKELNFQFVGDFVRSISPESYENRIDLYLTEDAKMRSLEGTAQRNFILNLSVELRIWLINIFAILLFFPLRKHIPKSIGMFAYVMFIGGFATIMSLTSGGGRFLHLFSMAFIVMFLVNIPKIPRSVFIAKMGPNLSWLLLLPIIYDIRAALDFYSISLFGNYITALFWENNVPLIDFIK